MERCAHLQRHDQLRAQRLGAIACTLHRGRMTGDGDLLRTVDVGRAHDLTVSRFLAGLAHDIERRTDDRGHRAHADGNGLLHVAAPASNEANGIGKRERAGRDVRRVFTKAVAGNERGMNAVGFEDAAGSDAGRENRRLRDFRERETIRGAFETERAERRRRRLAISEAASAS